jgi:hypothetical protein
MGTILLVILILVLIGAMPTWPYSRGWGDPPTSGSGLVLLILIILAEGQRQSRRAVSHGIRIAESSGSRFKACQNFVIRFGEEANTFDLQGFANLGQIDAQRCQRLGVDVRAVHAVHQTGCGDAVAAECA